MSKFKKGNKFIVTCENDQHQYKKGQVVTLLSSHEEYIMEFSTESGHKQFLSIHEVEYIPDYESSNRYKLKQAIKETGISSRKLSHFAVGNESFFYSQTGPARFKEYGDITEKRLNSSLTKLAFAERELLGVGAKTINEKETNISPKLSNFTKVGIIAIVILLLILIVKNLVV